MKMRQLNLLCSLLLFIACQPQTESTKAGDEQAIIDTLASQGNQFSQAYMKGDVETMTSLYTEDAVLFPGNSEYIRGTEAIRKYYTLAEGRRITHHKLISIEVEVSGSMASDFGHYEISGINGENAWGPFYGKYVVVWKRGGDGQWRMHLDMWNSRPQSED